MKCGYYNAQQPGFRTRIWLQCNKCSKEYKDVLMGTVCKCGGEIEYNTKTFKTKP